MTKHPCTIVFAVALAGSLAVTDVEAQAQPQAPSPPPASKGSVIPLHVQVVISRFQGEKKIGSVPYTLAVNAYTVPPFPPRPAQLKMGSSVPVMSPTTVKGKSTNDGVPDAQVNVSTFNYQNIGTQIDCSAIQADDGRFELNISIEDSSIYVDDQVVRGVAKGNEPPIFRSFRSRNDLILRDGQSTEFTAATDRISGEVIRIDITLKAMK